jgi:hypothetical protein
MIGLPEKIVRIHQSLAAHDVPHAFGGALALAWCTERARGTIDIDINIFVESEAARSVIGFLPVEITYSEPDMEIMLRDGQIRLWWEHTPLDIFLNTTRLHEQMARRCRWESFAGESVPFLSCQDIAVLKVFFNRTKDWADLEEMQAAGTLNLSVATATIIEYLGADDERIAKLALLKKMTLE